MSLRDVEDLLAERGVLVSYETIRSWVRKFGPQIAAQVRQTRTSPSDKWHLDEVVIMIHGKKHWLWRAVDSNGEILGILVQSRRNARAAKRFISRLIGRWGKPRVIVTDKLRSYSCTCTRKLPTCSVPAATNSPPHPAAGQEPPLSSTRTNAPTAENDGREPNLYLDFLAASARGMKNAAGAQISAPQGSGITGHSFSLLQFSNGQFIIRGTFQPFAASVAWSNRHGS